VVPRSTTTRPTVAAIRGPYGRPTARTPGAVAVRSSTTDIILVAVADTAIVRPRTGAAADTFTIAFLGRIPVAAGLPCMIAGITDAVIE